MEAVGRRAFGWDWSSTTHDAIGSDTTVDVIVRDLVGALGGVTHVPGGGLHGWRESVEAFDGDGYTLGRVYFGGRTDVHVLATSGVADVTRRKVVRLHGARTARVDTRFDTLAEFEEVAGVIEEASMGYGVRVTQMESSVRGFSLGKTVYLGAPKSAIRLRLYEKWRESPDAGYPQGTNRVEVQLRPPSRVKAIVSEWEPEETFCASRVTRAVADALDTYRYNPTKTMHVRRGVPDLERSLDAMGRQYGNTVERWLERTGGDMDTVLDRLLG